MAVKFNPFSGGLEIEQDVTYEGLPDKPLVAQDDPPADTDVLWVDTSQTASYSSLTVSNTGTNISFHTPTIYNTAVTPGTGDITSTLVGAQLGIIQKIYHQAGGVPQVPAGWVLMKQQSYVVSVLNVIYAEWAGGSRVEYWIVQEQA